MLIKSPEVVVWNALISDASVTSIAGHRVYPHMAPATSALPFIVWRRSGVSREQTLGAPMGVPTVSLTIEIFASTYFEARRLADAVRIVLDGYGGTFDNTQVSQCLLDGESDDVVFLDGSEVPAAYSVSQDYYILWQEI